MNRKTTSLFVTGGILTAIAIASVIAALVTDQPFFYLFSILFGIVGVTVLLCGVFNLSVVKAAKKNIADPSKIAYKTYGDGKEYVHLVAYPNKSQAARNAAVNTLGILGLIFAGRGFFTWGGSYPVDVFVSENELITNSAQANGKLLDKKFNRFPASEIADISFISEKKYEDVCVTLKGRRRELNLYIRSDKHSSDEVRRTFAMLLKPEVSDPFEAPATAATGASESAAVAEETETTIE